MKRFGSILFVCLCGIVVGLISCKDKKEAETDSVTVYGNVSDKTTGAPLSNVMITEENNVGGSSVTGTDGNYEFTFPLGGSSNGQYTLTATKENYSTAYYTLNMNDVDKNRRVKVDFQLTEKQVCTYMGQALWNGQPQPNVTICYYRYWPEQEGRDPELYKATETDAQGNYTIELGVSDIPVVQDYHVQISGETNKLFGLWVPTQPIPEELGKTIRANIVLE